jgi:type I restriction enzyme, S subunit
MENWNTYKLGDISKDIAYGYTASATNEPIGAKFLRITDIQGGNVNWDDVPYCEIDDQKKKQYQLEIGDIVIARTGNSTGENTIIKDNVDAVFASYLIRYQIDETKVFPFYVAYCLRSQNWWNFVQSIKSGSAQAGANAKQFARFEFKCPESIEEQKAIAKILSSLDDKIELNRQMNATLEAMARAVFKAWFVDFEPVRANLENRPSESASPEIAKLFPSEFENVIPKGWRIGTLRDCCLRVESGGTPSRKVENYWTNGTISWLTSGEVRKPIVLDTKEYISVEGYENSNAKLWKEGTTVVAMYGATAGEVCLLANEMTANQACCGLIPKDGFRSFLFTKTFQSKQQLASKSSGSAQQNLNQSIVANFQILLPDENCVKAFEKAIGKLFDKWIENEKENQKLAEIRDSLLPRLISGKIRVGAAEKEISLTV